MYIIMFNFLLDIIRHFIGGVVSVLLLCDGGGRGGGNFVPSTSRQGNISLSMSHQVDIHTGHLYIIQTTEHCIEFQVDICVDKTPKFCVSSTNHCNAVVLMLSLAKCAVFDSFLTEFHDFIVPVIDGSNQ